MARVERKQYLLPFWRSLTFPAQGWEHRLGEAPDVAWFSIFITLHYYHFNYLQAMGDHTFWFTCFLATVILLLPVVAWRFYRADVSPTLTDRARLRQRTDRKAKPKPEFRPFSGRRSRYVSQSVGQMYTG